MEASLPRLAAAPLPLKPLLCTIDECNTHLLIIPVRTRHLSIFVRIQLSSHDGMKFSKRDQAEPSGGLVYPFRVALMHAPSCLCFCAIRDRQDDRQADGKDEVHRSFGSHPVEQLDRLLLTEDPLATTLFDPIAIHSLPQEPELVSGNALERVGSEGL